MSFEDKIALVLAVCITVLFLLSFFVICLYVKITDHEGRLGSHSSSLGAHSGILDSHLDKINETSKQLLEMDVCMVENIEKSVLRDAKLKSLLQALLAELDQK